MQITLTMKLLPTKAQEFYLKETLNGYVAAINDVFDKMVSKDKRLKLSSSDIDADLPSALKNQAIRDGGSLFSKYKKSNKKSVAKKPVCIWNNQNYRIKVRDSKRFLWIAFPVWIDGRSCRIEMPMLVSRYHLKGLEGKLGTLRIIQRGRKWLAQVTVGVDIRVSKGSRVMGVDLGLKVPAVGQVENGKVKFFGNGRENKYVRRKNKEFRRELGREKNLDAIRKNRNKEQLWMRDRDHKISREIIDFALLNNVSIIRLEVLEGIRNTARTSRKNAKNLHMWSFHRLARYIEYKARLVGVKVEYVNPKHTSKLCPWCKTLNTASDRRYSCQCGFSAHRDRVGAMNIIHATVVDGVTLL